MKSLHTKTLCLLLAGVMALSMLSGCGGQPAAGQPNTPDNSPVETGGNIPDNVPNNEAPMVPPDDWEDPSQPDDGLPFPRDPRWDELKPGETAAQYYDIFIKSGMTVGEVVEAIENSDVYNEQFITWETWRDNGNYGAFNYQDLDKEVVVNSDTWKKESTSLLNLNIMCNDNELMRVYFLNQLPGEEGTIYHVRDLPIILVSPKPGSGDTLTFMGPVSEIKSMGKQGAEGLLEVFQARDPNTRMDTKRTTHKEKGYMSYNFYSQFSFSWNGYSLWTDETEGFEIFSTFDINFDTDVLYNLWYLDGCRGGMHWAPEG